MKSSWVEIDLEALQANILNLRGVLHRSTGIIFVVKADAYGHGLISAARAAVQAGVRWLGVAHLHEARRVRDVLPEPHILIMGVVEPDDVAEVCSRNFTPMIVSWPHAQALNDAARAAGITVRGHLKIDTGMGRLGVDYTEAPDVMRALSSLTHLECTGVCSHFAAVEPQQPDRAEKQAARFLPLAKALEHICGRTLMKHLSSSRAIGYHAEWDLDAIRPGICLYGYGASDPGMRFHTRPCLQWKCAVMQVKEVPADYPVGYYGTYTTPQPTRLAVLSAGYADGYLRALSNRGHVLIRGRRCKVVGRVSMNWITVDVGLTADVAPGDEAVLIGVQGKQSIWAGELARLCRTIPYEILVGIARDTERRHLHSGEDRPPFSC